MIPIGRTESHLSHKQAEVTRNIAVRRIEFNADVSFRRAIGRIIGSASSQKRKS
jgi:hypothetical protein